MSAIIIFLGGGLGAVLRHLVNNSVTDYWKTDFPFGIMLINIVGSCLMGLCAGLFAKLALPQELRLFLTVGILGGFTTFSAFSLDTMLLLDRGAYGQAACYVTASVALALAGVMGGVWLSKALLSI